MKTNTFLLCSASSALLLALVSGVTAQTPAPAPAPATAPAEDFDPSDLTNPLSGLPAPDPVPAPAKVQLPSDPELPQPFDPSTMSTTLKTSPFNRAVNLSESLVLTGIAYVDGKPMATLLDKETKRTYVVSDEPNASGWTLASATPTTDLKRLQVKVNVAGEVVTIRHDSESQEEALKKHKTAPGSTASSGNERPSGDDRFSRGGERRGPTPENIERYKKLSDGGKEKLRKHFEENREKVMNMNPEERKSFMEKSFNKIVTEDESKQKK